MPKMKGEIKLDAKTLLEKKQERANLTVQIRAILDKYEGAEIVGDDKTTLGNLEAKFDEVDATILREEKQLERERKTGEREAEAKQEKEPDALIKAWNNCLIIGSGQSFMEYAALQMSNPTQAGYLVAPEQFQLQLIKELADATFMRQKANVLPPLVNAQSLGFPTRTAGMGQWAWGTELSEPTDDTTLAYGKREFKPNPGMSGIKVSKTLIRNLPNADSYIRDEIVEEEAKNLEIAYMMGDGVAKPLGLFTPSADGIPVSRDVSEGNTATEIKFDGLISVQESVKTKYQANAEWIFHRDAVKQLRKLKDANQQYIWQPSVIAGQPELLLSKPINRSEYAPNTFTTGQYVGIYGDLKYYWIVDALTLEIQVLMELYARTNQAYYLSRVETDGAPVQAAAFARVKLG